MSTTLLITDGCQQCSRLIAAFEFLNLPITTTCKQKISIDSPKIDLFSLVIACNLLGQSIINDLISQINEHYANKPVLLLGAKELPSFKNVIGSIDTPIKESQFSKMLIRAQSYLQTTQALGDKSLYPELNNMVGQSMAMQKLRRIVSQIAKSDASVLLLGESSTGKTTIAQNIHNLSARHDKPFVQVNCGAMVAELLENELFGHEKNALKGRFAMANSGTLLLNEISQLPFALQVKLLRVIQDGCFSPVGSKKSLPVDVRMITATSQDLEQAVSEKRFREDLYYHLNVFPIKTTRLRNRHEDIPLLLNYFTQQIGQRLNTRLSFSHEAIHILRQYGWPGNLGELTNLVERLMTLYPNGRIDRSHLEEKYLQSTSMKQPATSPPIASNKEGINLKKHLNQTELNLIKQALKHCNGVVSHAAKYLSMGRTTLIEKMRKYGLKYSNEKENIG